MHNTVMNRLYATLCARARCFKRNLWIHHRTSFEEATCLWILQAGEYLEVMLYTSGHYIEKKHRKLLYWNRYLPQCVIYFSGFWLRYWESLRLSQNIGSCNAGIGQRIPCMRFVLAAFLICMYAMSWPIPALQLRMFRGSRRQNAENTWRNEMKDWGGRHNTTGKCSNSQTCKHVLTPVDIQTICCFFNVSHPTNRRWKVHVCGHDVFNLWNNDY